MNTDPLAVHQRVAQYVLGTALHSSEPPEFWCEGLHDVATILDRIATEGFFPEAQWARDGMRALASCWLGEEVVDL